LTEGVNSNPLTDDIAIFGNLYLQIEIFNGITWEVLDTDGNPASPLLREKINSVIFAMNSGKIDGLDIDPAPTSSSYILTNASQLNGANVSENSIDLNKLADSACTSNQIIKRKTDQPGWECANKGISSCHVIDSEKNAPLSIACANNEILTGGGCDAINNAIIANHPDGNGWRCNVEGGGMARVYAVCCE
jgi:hypothetical protein